METSCQSVPADRQRQQQKQITRGVQQRSNTNPPAGRWLRQGGVPRWKNTHCVSIRGETHNGIIRQQHHLFIAYTNGYKHGHFKCQHGHCAERTRDDFLRSIGYTTEEYPPPTACEHGVEPKKYSLPSKESLHITADALATARLTPPCIVQNYLYCDVGGLVAPGGTGKTTLMLHEMVHIVLKTAPVWPTRLIHQ